MQHRELAHLRVGAVGLGAMQLSAAGRPGEVEAVRTLHAAFDAGVSLIDTADAYGLDADDVGHNERLVAQALRSYGGDADGVLVATKGGVLRGADGSWRFDGRPEHLRRACDASLRALGVEAIGLYQLHRVDPAVPFEDSVGVLEELRLAGKVRLVGLSNVSIQQLDAASAITPVVSVQNHWSPAHREGAAEARACEARGVAFLPWRPFGGQRAGALAEEHPAFGAVARERAVSPHQVCLAWMLAKGPRIIPLPGATRTASVLDSVAAAELILTEGELRLLDAAEPEDAGARPGG